MRVHVLVLFYTSVESVTYNRVAGVFNFLEDAYKMRDMLEREYEKTRYGSPIRLGYSIETMEVQ